MKEKIINIANKIIEYSLYGMMFFIPISNGAIEVFASLAIFAFIIKKILKPEFKFLKGIEYIFLFLFILFSVLSLFNSGPYIIKSLIGLFFKWFEYIMIFLIVQDTLHNRRRIRNAIFIFLSVAGIVGIDGLSQKFLGVEFLRHRELIIIGKDLPAITASFNHYNNFGVYLICVLLISICLIFSKLTIRIKISLTCLIISLLICLLFTFSRGAWLVFIASLVFILILSRRFKIIIPLILLFIISLAVFAPLRERIFYTFRYGGDADRLIIWQVSLKMIKETPFLGKGVNTFMDYFGQYYPQRNASYAHNCYLQIWAETGIFSLESFLIFLFIILTKAIRTFKINNDYLLLGVTSAIVSFLIYSFLDTPLYSLQLATLFWYLLGIMKNLTHSATPPSP